MESSSNTIHKVLLCLVMTAFYCYLDMRSPISVAGGISYVAVIIASLWIQNRAFTFMFAIICSLLTLAKPFYLEPISNMWPVYTNSALCIFAIWISAVLGHFFTRAEEQARLQETIKEQKELFQNVIEAMSEGVIVADEKGKFLIWNTSSEEVLCRFVQPTAAISFR